MMYSDIILKDIEIYLDNITKINTISSVKYK